MAILQQRPTKGARISTFYPVKTVPPIASLDSAFQLQEYISLLIRQDPHDVERIVSIPGRRSGKEREGSDDMREEKETDSQKGDGVVDEPCWIYEQLRRLAQDLSHPLITTLQQECTRQTCPEMKAGEWLYLCVAHGNDGSMEQCCAIDYILHTLDSATALLNSPRAFPSRMSIAPTSQRHFASLARRLGRIFAHAYYHHREAFEQAEAESSLYERFLALTSKFDLVPAEFLVIPPRMQAVHEERERERGREAEPRHEQSPQERHDSPPQEHKGWSGMSDSSSVVDLNLREQHEPEPEHPQEGLSASPPEPTQHARNPSPRKGRSRTDTMVYSEAVNVAEELAKGEGFSEADLDRAIAQERMLTEEPAFEEPLPDHTGTIKGGHFAELSREDPHGTIRFPDSNAPYTRILLGQLEQAQPEEAEEAEEPVEHVEESAGKEEHEQEQEHEQQQQEAPVSEPVEAPHVPEPTAEPEPAAEKVDVEETVQQQPAEEVAEAAEQPSDKEEAAPTTEASQTVESELVVEAEPESAVELPPKQASPEPEDVKTTEEAEASSAEPLQDEAHEPIAAAVPEAASEHDEEGQKSEEVPEATPEASSVEEPAGGAETSVPAPETEAEEEEPTPEPEEPTHSVEKPAVGEEHEHEHEPAEQHSES